MGARQLVLVGAGVAGAAGVAAGVTGFFAAGVATLATWCGFAGLVWAEAVPW